MPLPTGGQQPWPPRSGGAVTISRDQVQRILYARNRMWD